MRRGGLSRGTRRWVYKADGAIVVLKNLAGQRQRIEKAEIIKRDVLENSVMPPVGAILKSAQIADVVAFLRES